ncbi:hypothetical protein OCL06_15800 [Alteromonas sp. ASW11-19]|uniref:Uncharacterized protein n=1 Tax=Alteromonas salexigens TaxID=2982530 RepID=A0ABT2VRV5_9ALTE|nr:hypothetical protein [Alteromonas salexigens]MCU7556055.1 hypothetical protein [Alteromonas salexigens]
MKYSGPAALLWLSVMTFPAQAQQVEEAKAGEPLKLEATIRGNKEQPRVLSIVPWQLPKYRPIEGALNWQPALISPRPIHRDSFTRQLAIEQVMQGASQDEN